MTKIIVSVVGSYYCQQVTSVDSLTCLVLFHSPSVNTVVVVTQDNNTFMLSGCEYVWYYGLCVGVFGMF